ncbi:MAG: universal stress protein [Ardenticatenaceae bacterium]|nr:universal stress protein [Ardenticatenaceae bacterium]
MFKELLVPLDGSVLAEKVLPLAQELAAKFDSHVTLLRVVEPIFLPTTGNDALNTRFVVSMMEESAIQTREYLARLEADMADKTAVSTITREGSPAAETILDVAEEVGADTIIMSTHGRGGLSRLVYGSVASKLLSQSPVPIFLVRAEEELDLTLPAIQDLEGIRTSEGRIHNAETIGQLLK